MITAHDDVTLAELIAQRPSRARVLEDLGLDYCCGGGRTVATACAEKHVDLADLWDRLEASDRQGPTPNDVDLRFAPLPELIEHIVAVHHRFLRQELPRLGKLLERVVTAHGAAHPELKEVQTVFQSLCEELTSHMWKEEHVLFPWIAILDDPLRSPATCGSVTNPIHVMEHEHRDAAEALQRLRSLTGEYQAPADACNTYRVLLAGLMDLERDLHQHVHKENNIFFPRATALEQQI